MNLKNLNPNKIKSHHQNLMNNALDNSLDKLIESKMSSDLKGVPHDEYYLTCILIFKQS